MTIGAAGRPSTATPASTCGTGPAESPAAADAAVAALAPLARLLGRAAARAWLLEGAGNDNDAADRDGTNEPGITDAG